MKNYKLAWRNLWRNRRRTIITATSVFFALFFALITRSIQIGSYDYMYKNVIESYSGYIQVQGKDWWDEKTLDNNLYYGDDLKQSLLDDPNIEEIIPRLESYALASSGPNTKGIIVMGIDPMKESLLSNIMNKVVKYQLSPEVIRQMQNSEMFPEEAKQLASLFENSCYYDETRILLDLKLDPENEECLTFLKKISAFKHENISLGEPGVWLGEKLARYLELSPGDTIVLMGQGYHGSTAAGKFEIKGLVKLPVPELSSSVVYMPYDIAQEFYNSGENLSSVVLDLKDNQDKAVAETIDRISMNSSKEVRVIGWREMNEAIIQQMQADNIGGMFVIGVLYLVIGFGIFGTILMMTAERKREFGVLVAIGMQKKKLSSVMNWEMIYLGLLGIALGMIVCIPIILYGANHSLVFKGEVAHMMEEYDFEPKLAFQPIGSYFLWQIFIVGSMVGVSIIHPLRKISKLKVVNALRA